MVSSISLLKEINVNLDNSKVKIRKEYVRKKEILRGKSTRYYITFSQLGEIKVNADLYTEFTTNEPVNVYIKEGYLGKPWVQKIEK